MVRPVTVEARILLALALIFLTATDSPGQVFKVQKEALRQAFTDSAEIKRQTLFLTADQLRAIQDLARTKVESKIVTYYAASRSDSLLGYALFETAIVRTKPTTFMAVLNANGSLRYVEILAFYEPMDYLPTRNWFDLFRGRFLDSELWPNRGIHNVSGATLSVQAITFGVRRALATFKIAIQRGELN